LLQLTISLRALVFVLLLAAVAVTGSDVAHGAPAALTDLTQDGNIIFTGPGVDGARDIRTTNNDGGLRFYNGNGALTNPPDGAAIQFFGNDRNVFNGQAFIDSGAHANAAIIFRTAGAGQAVAERLRIDHDGNVGIGTAPTPSRRLHIAGGQVAIGTPASACFENGLCVEQPITTASSVVADTDVVAQSGTVRTGIPSNTNCNLNGDICSTKAVVADTDVKAGGNGALKAAVYANCGTAGSLTRSFNNVNATAIVLTNGGLTGQCLVDFQFSVADRYIVATAQTDSGNPRSVNVDVISGETVAFFRTDLAGTGVNGNIFVAVY
jgi:hypothetical protein